LTLVYTPPANFTGVDQFEYRVTDTGQPPETSTGTVFVTVNGDNSPPVFVGVNGDPNARSLAFNESGETEQVFEYDLNTWFTDPEGDASTFAVEVIGAAGAAEIVEASIVTGSQDASVLRLRLLSYRSGEVTLRIVATNVNDGPQSTTDIPVTVNDVNHAPRLIGSLDPTNVNEDEVVVRNLATIFSDPDGDVLTYRVSRIGGVNNPTAAQIAASGLVQSVAFVNGVMTINLVPDAFGSVSMEITARDAEFSVSHPFTLNVAPQPDAPRGVADQFSISYGGRLQVSNRASGVLANDLNPDVIPISNQGLRVDLASVTDPARGTLQMNQDGTFVYTNSGRVASDPAFDTFTYRPINADNQLGNVVTVTIQLTASAYQNPIPGFQFDVTADGAISPIDALRIINLLATRRVSGVPVSELTTPPPDFYDVDGSGVITPLDAILVINEIARRNRLAQGGGEGEQVSAGVSESVWLASTSEVFASSAITLPEVERDQQPSAFTFDDLTSDPFETTSDDGDDPADLLADDLISLRQSSQSGDGSAEASDEALLSWFAAD